jgi:hypothetical protein
MKKYLLAGLAAVAVAVPASSAAAPAAEASYGQYLSGAEACGQARAIAREKWHVVPGSSRGNCQVARRSASKVYVWLTYRTYDAGWWTTKFGIHETAVDYRWRILGDHRV